MQSQATTVTEYLSELPDERRTALAAVRAVILANLPPGYEEVMNWGMIAYQVPLATCPDTYNGQPLAYAGLASQKQYMSLYLTGIYLSEDARTRFEAAYRATGKRFDAGKSCVRFKRLEDLPLDLVGEAIAAWSVDDYVRRVDASMSARKQRGG
jgi:hypothetical protein